MSDIRLSQIIAPHFYHVHRDIKQHTHTHYWVDGGRGSTKSSFVSLELVLSLKRTPDTHALVMRKVAATIKDSVFNQILWAIDMLGLNEEFKSTLSPLEITYLPTGQKIFFRGADDPYKIKSVKPKFGYIAFAWYEELDQFRGMEEIRNINQSVMRGGNDFWIFYSFNPPKSRDSWVNIEKAEEDETRLIHHSTYLDVPPEWLGKQFIYEAEHLKKQNPRSYEHEYLGVATGIGGNVFDNVSRKSIPDEEISRFDRIYRGVDWGWFPDPFAYNAMHYQANERRLYIFDEINGNRLSNLKIIEDHFVQHGIGKDDKITADSGGEGPKSIADFRSRGYYMRPARKGPGSVEYSMKWLQSLEQIIIDPVRCPNTAKEFVSYEYEQNKDGQFITGYPDANNHHIDAVRYALEPVWRRRGE